MYFNAQIKFPEERRYPIAFVTFLAYLAWHPLGDFIESLFIGWSIVPCELFSHNWYMWWLPLRTFNQSYTFAFFAYFIPVTIIVFAYYYLKKKNKALSWVVTTVLVFFFILTPAMNPQISVAYSNDVEGFRRHHMEPLNLWMFFHMFFWLVWMVFPHIIGLFTTEKGMVKLAGVVWLLFLIVWLSTWTLGQWVYIPVICYQ